MKTFRIFRFTFGLWYCITWSSNSFRSAFSQCMTYCGHFRATNIKLKYTRKLRKKKMNLTVRGLVYGLSIAFTHYRKWFTNFCVLDSAVQLLVNWRCKHQWNSTLNHRRVNKGETAPFKRQLTWIVLTAKKSGNGKNPEKAKYWNNFWWKLEKAWKD